MNKRSGGTVHTYDQSHVGNVKTKSRRHKHKQTHTHKVRIRNWYTFLKSSQTQTPAPAPENSFSFLSFVATCSTWKRSFVCIERTLSNFKPMTKMWWFILQDTLCGYLQCSTCQGGFSCMISPKSRKEIQFCQLMGADGNALLDASIPPAHSWFRIRAPLEGSELLYWKDSKGPTKSVDYIIGVHYIMNMCAEKILGLTFMLTVKPKHLKYKRSISVLNQIECHH